MIARTQCARYIIAGHQAKTEAVSSRLVFLSVVLEILPKVIRQRILLGRIGIKDAGELRPRRGKFREFKRPPVPEADEKNPFTMLRDDLTSIDDFKVNSVAQNLRQGVVDYLKSPALVVPPEIFDVFKNECGGPVMFEYLRDFKEQVALFLVIKPMLPSKAQFLGDSRDAEWLAWKPAAEYFVPGYVGNSHSVDVSVGLLPEIGLIRDLGILVPIRRENTFATRPLKSYPETTDTAEEINEPKLLRRISHTHEDGWLLAQKQRVCFHGRRFGLFRFDSHYNSGGILIAPTSFASRNAKQPRPAGGGLKD